MDTSRTFLALHCLGFTVLIELLLYMGRVWGGLPSLPSSLTAESFHLDAEETGKDTKREKEFMCFSWFKDERANSKQRTNAVPLNEFNFDKNELGGQV